MSVPAVIYIALTCIVFGINITEYVRDNKKSQIIGLIIAQAIIYSILIWGGFFN